MPTSNTASRRHQRNPYKEKMEICLHSRLRDESLIAVGSNISDSGMCIYSDIMPEEGERLEFRSFLPVPSTQATVRWVKKDVDNLYKMGLMFVD